MEGDHLHRADPASLAQLMRIGSEGEEVWSAGDLADMLDHQLAADLDTELPAAGTWGSEERARIHAGLQPPIRTFRDLFEHPRPPIELLRAAQDYSKTCRLSEESPIPAEVATVLYVASIAAALTKLGQRITRLDDDALKHSLTWALNQPWLDPALRDLLSAVRLAGS